MEKTQILPRNLQKKAEIHIFLDNKHVSTYPINLTLHEVGREGDIRTPKEDIYVGRKQLQIKVDLYSKTFFLYLLPYKNPVYINGRKFGEEVKSPYILRDGDKIKMGGRTTLVFKLIE